MVSTFCLCGKALEIPDEYAGKRVKCPQCGNGVYVPAATASDSLRLDPPAAAALRTAATPPLAPEDEEPEQSMRERIPPPFKSDVRIRRPIDTVEAERLKVEVIAWDRLEGASAIANATGLYYLRNSGVQLKQVKLTLMHTAVRVERARLHYLHGQLDMKELSGADAEEAVVEVSGTGEAWLEPTFGHFLVMRLRQDAYIADRGIVYAADAGVAVATEDGGDGRRQTKVSGSGICVLRSPVPASELECVELQRDRLVTHGPLSVVRSAEVDCEWVAGGPFQAFTGLGRVWLAPTQGVYERLFRVKSDTAVSADRMV